MRPELGQELQERGPPIYWVPGTDPGPGEALKMKQKKGVRTLGLA